MVDDLISRQVALKELAVYIHLIDKTLGKGTLTDDDCMEAAKSVLGEDELPAVQPEIIRCKECAHRDEYGCCRYWKGQAMSEHPIPTDDYDFCSMAKRRGDG